MEEIRRITKRRRRLRTVGEPHPWEPRHMRLSAMRFADSVGEPEERRNVTLGGPVHWVLPARGREGYGEPPLCAGPPKVRGRHGLPCGGRSPQEGLREGSPERHGPRRDAARLLRSPDG